MSTAPGNDVVADIANKLFSALSCNLLALFVTTILIQHGPITHRSTGSKPDSFVHSRSQGLFLVLDLVCHSRVTYLMIFSPIPKHSAYARCVGHPFFQHPSSASNACMSACNFSYLLLFLSMYFSEFKLERYVAPHSLGQPRLINLVPIRPLEFTPSLFVSTVKTLNEG